VGVPGSTESGPAVFFDLYGTLIDIRTDEEDPWVYAALAQYLGYVRVSIDGETLRREYRSRVRADLDRNPERFPEIDVYTIFREILTEYRRVPATPGAGSHVSLDTPDVSSLALSAALLFRSLTRRHFSVFPDALRVLGRLRAKYRLGLISDAQWAFAEPELEMVDLARLFPVRILSSRLGVKKPDPRMFTEAMRALGVAPEASIYIGDNPPRDLVGARGVGMKCILFRGADAEYDGLRPDACFQHYGKLEPLIDSQFSAQGV